MRLGARDARRLARGLRDLSERSNEENPEHPCRRWLPLPGTKWVEMPRSEGTIRLDRQAIRDLASALERASQNAPDDSPPRERGDS